MEIKNYTFENYLNGNCKILDSHIHIGLIKNAASFSKQIKDYKCISYGVLPSLYFLEKKLENKNLVLGSGFHPWYINKEGAYDELNILFKNMKDIEYVGEIGLDFSEKRKENKNLQIEIFEKICKELSNYKNKVICIHCVKASNEIIKILKETKIYENNIVVLHWFNAPMEQVEQAEKLGCYFSCGPKMLKSKNGYNIARYIPENKIFLETDIPWDTDEIKVEDHYKMLNDLIMKLRKIKSY